MRNIDRRRFLKATTGGVAGVATGLAGCTGDSGDGGGDGGDGGGGGTTQASSGGSLTDINLAAAHYPTLTASTTTLVAEEQGFFEDHGLSNNEVTSFSGGGTTVRGVVTGGLDAGKGALAAVVKAYLAGAPVHLTAMMMAGNTLEFHAMPDNDELNGIEDIAGKRVAVTNPGSSTHATLVQSILNTDGLSVDDVEIVFAGGLGEAFTALEEGNVDAALNVIPISLQMLDAGKRKRLWTGWEVAPNVTEHVMLMGQQLLTEKPEVAKGIVRAHVDAMGWMRDNLQEAAKIWASATDWSEELTIRSMEQIGPDIWRPELTEDIVTTTGNILKPIGVVNESTEIPYGEILDQSALYEENRLDWA